MKKSHPMNYSPLLTTNICLYLVLHSHCYQKKPECSEPATNNLLMHIRRKVWKIRGEMAATCTDKCSLHEISPAPASPCRGLHGTEPFLMHKHLSLGHKHQPPGPGLRGRPLTPKRMLKICMECLGSLNFLMTAYCIKVRPHFSFLRLYSEVVANDISLVQPPWFSCCLASAWMDVATTGAWGLDIWTACMS